jgi:F0F1-type ATP synthase membrane subunit b/b'
MKRLLILSLFTAAVCFAEEGSAESAEPSAVWKWANFAILAAGLGYLIAKNLPAFFQTRTSSIQKGIAEAQQAKLDAERRAAEMEARMSALGSDIERFRTQAAAEMEQEGQRIRRETAEQIQKLERQASLEIESAGKWAQRELRAYAATLAVDLAEQRIRTRLDAGTEAALIDDFVKDLAKESKN